MRWGDNWIERVMSKLEQVSCVVVRVDMNGRRAWDVIIVIKGTR